MKKMLELTHPKTGETKPLAEWARIKGIPYMTLRNRVKDLGWDHEKALETPVGERKRFSKVDLIFYRIEGIERQLEEIVKVLRLVVGEE